MERLSNKRNYEWRSIREVPGLEVTRDGDLRRNGTGNHVGGGVVTDVNGEHMTIQMMISKAFPDIPMRETPTW